MGWRLDDRLELLFLDLDGNPDTRFDACEVVTHEIPIGEYNAIGRLIGPGGLAFIDGNEERIREVVERVTATIDEWNLLDPDGTPTPINADGLLSHPATTTIGIVNAWRRAQLEGPRPFGSPSHDGAPPAELPVTPLAS